MGRSAHRRQIAFHDNGHEPRRRLLGPRQCAPDLNWRPYPFKSSLDGWPALLYRSERTRHDTRNSEIDHPRSRSDLVECRFRHKQYWNYVVYRYKRELRPGLLSRPIAALSLRAYETPQASFHYP